MIKRFIAAAALTGLAAFGFASASYATPNRSVEAYAELIKGVRDNGVKIVFNDPICSEFDAHGMYVSVADSIVICQENGVPGGPRVDLTAKDVYVFRHEVQHMIQDCVAGELGDNALAPVYDRPSELALDVLGKDAVANITQVYREGGADDLTLLLEYEAFAVASMNVPAEQAQDLKDYCGVN